MTPPPRLLHHAGRTASSTVNDREICVHALKRSGHHAVIEWVLHNSEGTYLFLNHAQPGNSPLDALYIEQKPASRIVTNMDGLCLSRESCGDHRKKSLLIYNYEHRPFRQITKGSFWSNREAFVGESRIFHNVIVVRDPLNNAASVRKNFPGRFGTFARIWKQHAREYLGKTNLLTCKIPVSFNLWNESDLYRSELARMLGLAHADLPTSVSRWGGGSSFDGRDPTLLADRQRLNRRWETFAGDEVFLDLFLDKEFVRIATAFLKATSSAPALQPPLDELVRRSRKRPTIAGARSVQAKRKHG